MELNKIKSIAVEKRNNEHHVNVGGCKAVNDEHNEQEGIETSMVETR